MARITDTTVTKVPPSFLGEPLGAHNLIPGGAKLDASQFYKDGSATVTLTANAAQGAISISVGALRNPIPSGTVLRFSADEFATTTANAAATTSPTTIAVEALVNALESGDTAEYPGTTGIIPVPAGTPVGRTYAERDADTAFGMAGASDDEVYLTAFDVSNALGNNDVELIRPQTLIKENYLSGFSALASGVKTKLRGIYQMVKGVS